MKKIISLFIAITLILALCPLSFAADTFDGYTYVFSSNAFVAGTPEINTAALLTTHTPGSLDLDATDSWKLAAMRTTSGIGSNSGGVWWKGRTGEDYVLGVTVVGMEIYVEKGGKYKPTLTYSAQKYSPAANVWLVKEGTTAGGFKPEHFTTSGNDPQSAMYVFIRNLSDTGKLGTVDMWGEGGSGITDFDGKEIELDGGAKYYLLFAGFNTKNPGFTRYDSAETSSNPMYFAAIKSFTLTPVQDEELTEAFKPEGSVTAEDYSEPAVISITKDGDKIDSIKNSDGTHNITAPEKNKAGAKFLYWAKGLSTQKRILIGKTNELKNYVPDAKYANYLIPVYENEISGTEYYNANGQLIPDAQESDRPSMAGYGTATGWDKYGDTDIRVAHYDLAKPEANINVTVINGTGTDTYAFGDTVTCTANGTGTFKCWTKSGIYGTTEPEIVSVDSTYTFKAWETCTVTAVYADHHYTGAKMKIIIDTFDAATGTTGVMAEFIGLDSAVEKGIMFTDSSKNTTKIAMTTKDNQFTVIADGKGTYEGYAIVENSTGGYTLITDGAYTK